MHRPTVGLLVTCALALFASQVGRAAAPTLTTVPGDSRASVVFRPAGLSLSTPVPLVILLHGSGSTPESLISWSRFDKLASQQGFVVASLSSGLNPSWLAFESQNSEVDVDYMRSEITALVKTQNIDPNRVFVVGFSNGGAMAYRAACELAPQIAGVGVVSSKFGMSTTCHPAHPVAVMGVFGTADDLVPFNGSVQVERGKTVRVEAPAASIARWRAFDSCPASPTESGSSVVLTQIWQPCAAGTAVSYTVIQGGIHTWSGAPGLDPSAPNAQFPATTALWDFLSAHPLQSSAPVVPTPPKVDALIGAVTLRRNGAHTKLVVALKLGEPVSGRETLSRAGRTVVARKVNLRQPGSVSLVTQINGAVKPGRYTMKLDLVDRGGAKRSFVRSVVLRFA